MFFFYYTEYDGDILILIGGLAYWILTKIYTIADDIMYYPMFGADSRFWLANNHEVYTCISRLTSSAWHLMKKGYHWWRHNSDHDRRPLSLPLQCDLAPNIVFIWWFRPDKRDIWERFQNLTNIIWAWDKFVTPWLLPRILEFIHA